jgi:hypothetical protein
VWYSALPEGLNWQKAELAKKHIFIGDRGRSAIAYYTIYKNSCNSRGAMLAPKSTLDL